ncbi:MULTISPECIES: zinc-ribbon domain-containing protein [Gordonibacter]|uniref:Zinc-ribbon domain-containing protein n=1 Tax=Gordonibacter faecis TaxID=3047475 RepID=A0ABT7DPT8_9ACTN|nr:MULTISPECIES: zinc-ribbon domain-containing protein [unclassified Gordonibacter]MDJ1651565.1 zinc-ribbon domain-containing protein [Gordonibacter sp. KGMB12511]HIW76987.1 zinc-ribbon domain-containing protein [Candidatus Gordonibacter avicola]
MCFRPADVKAQANICPACGAENLEYAAICDSCGAELDGPSGDTADGAPLGIPTPPGAPAAPKAPSAPKASLG